MNGNYWTPPANINGGELLVVACTEHYFEKDYVRDISLPQSWGIDLECRFSNDRSLIPQADALWFHGPSVKWLPEKLPGQPWIVMTMESDINYPFLREPRAMELFDIHMTYQLHSDVPVLYPTWGEYHGFLEAPVSLEAKNNENTSFLYAASNPVEYRDNYVSALMQRLPVDSVGSCLHNLEIPGFRIDSANTDFNWFGKVYSLIQRYKFYLAFENSRTHDYVSEKIFMALAAGSVPVYCGAENIREFIPDENAVVLVDDFSSPHELAEYLLFLDSNDDEYMKYLEWKKRGYSDDFRRLVAISSIDPLQRMFIKLAHGCDHDCRCGGRMR